MKDIELIRFGRVLAEKRLVWGTSGNISKKTGQHGFLISAGGTCLGHLEPNDIIRCRMDTDGWEGDKRPSIETGMHRRIYQACPDISAVVHSQAIYSTIAACSSLEIPTDVLPEAMAYLDHIQRIPYLHPGSEALAEAVASHAKSGSILILENHGVVCLGSSLHDAVMKTEALEFVCRLLVISQSHHININRLGDKVQREFIKHLSDIGRDASLSSSS